MENEYKYTLKWADIVDSKKARAYFDYACRMFTIMRDCEPKLVSHKDYEKLIANGEIMQGNKYWGVTEGRLGMVILTDYNKYSTDWEKVNNGFTDFSAGWDACKNQ